MTQNECGTAVPPETIDRATRGLVNMGFAKNDVKRAVDQIVRNHPHGVDVQALVREAIAALT